MEGRGGATLPIQTLPNHTMLLLCLHFQLPLGCHSERNGRVLAEREWGVWF